MIVTAEPSDGWTQIERLLLRQMIINTYKQMKDPIDKFIVIAIHESKYRQEEVASILEISQSAVCKRLRNVKLKMRKLRAEGKL